MSVTPSTNLLVDSAVRRFGEERGEQKLTFQYSKRPSLRHFLQPDVQSKGRASLRYGHRQTRGSCEHSGSPHLSPEIQMSGVEAIQKTNAMESPSSPSSALFEIAAKPTSPEETIFRGSSDFESGPTYRVEDPEYAHKPGSSAIA